MDWVVGLFYQEREEGWDFHTKTEGYADSVGFQNRLNYITYYLPNRLPVAPTDVWWSPTIEPHGRPWLFLAKSIIDLMRTGSLL
ncbi:MAG: hypothetical protein Ct9H300mP4_04260 [Gammaproteobacteria bacterium]|nr:MAG: hypothetical protein Ct9H300mP4_04260 [Gammaproteobacteria bacterium]